MKFPTIGPLALALADALALASDEALAEPPSFDAASPNCCATQPVTREPNR
jgi:hypothetical protein